jgi:1,4-alpha-glucan branching enzyme
MSIRKQYLKTRPVCKVTFKIDPSKGNSARKACIVGEFNGWSPTASPMKRLKNGAFTATLDLEPGREYQFRYLLGKHHWANESEADREVLTPYGDSYNSVIVI